MHRSSFLSCEPLAHTYSIVACDHASDQIGIAVQSHYFGVGSVVPWAEAGVGAVATQAFANTDYGPEGLALMRQGLSASQALERLLQRDEEREIRQVAMLDARGGVAVHTGQRCVAAAGHLSGNGFVVQANMMLNEGVWPAMKRAYEESTGDLCDRLLTALEAAQAAGGDIRGQQAAAMIIVSATRTPQPWRARLFDLRVEDHARPVEELRRLVTLRKAWLLFEQSNERLLAQRPAEAVALLRQAIALDPDNAELKFRGTAILLQAGEVPQALALLHEVFASNPAWTELVPRLAAVGLIPNDPALLTLILAQQA
ncbi:DUF1028 domain-containing protein [Thermogemmatispora sp.]|uniref:DUF1028 domain-containing protein n=1 Tax=Thermogemmatispora sp. TaxID=1968838 RepID=UPI001D28C2AD|nr:DUF1028 domain-containing protein [Thermogemmatispora sp.]MBX5449927.1 DUF1028 domain-containing protein [Thermogemmatispora sp.]